jgi:hypothetical protein
MSVSVSEGDVNKVILHCASKITGQERVRSKSIYMNGSLQLHILSNFKGRFGSPKSVHVKIKIAAENLNTRVVARGRIEEIVSTRAV